MHVLIVCQYFWPESFRINDLAQGLVERGHQVTVLTGMPNYPQGELFSGYKLFSPAKESHEGVNIIRVPIFPRGNGRAWRLALNYLSFVISASILGPFRCRENYDVIFVYEPSPVTQGLPAIVMKWIKRIPLVFYVQDLWPESLSATGAVSSPFILKRVGSMVKFIYQCCDKILVQSRGFIERVVAIGASPEKVFYLPNSAESLYQAISVAADAPERAHMPDGFVVMFAGNVGEAQDFPTILQAAEHLREHDAIHFVVVGNGRKYEWLEQEIKTRDLSHKVHLLGRHPVEAMPTYFALADLMLVTLKDEPIFALTIPAKIQSYLACAKPVVAALNGEGANVIIEANAGEVAAAEDPEGLAAAIKKLYQLSDEARLQMGTNAHDYYKRHFERETVLDKLESELENSINAKDVKCAF